MQEKIDRLFLILMLAGIGMLIPNFAVGSREHTVFIKLNSPNENVYLTTFYGLKRYSIIISVRPSTSSVDVVLLKYLELDKLLRGEGAEFILVLNNTCGDKVSFLPDEPNIYVFIFRLREGEFANVMVKVIGKGFDERILLLSSIFIFVGISGKFLILIYREIKAKSSCKESIKDSR